MRNNGDNFDGYLDNIYNHRFVLCPEGNGIDTHRLWECLYMGTIPIVKANKNVRFYEDLPILMVNEWKILQRLSLRRSGWDLGSPIGRKRS